MANKFKSMYFSVLLYCTTRELNQATPDFENYHKKLCEPASLEALTLDKRSLCFTVDEEGLVDRHAGIPGPGTSHTLMALAAHNYNNSQRVVVRRSPKDGSFTIEKAAKKPVVITDTAYVGEFLEEQIKGYDKAGVKGSPRAMVHQDHEAAFLETMKELGFTVIKTRDDPI